MFFDGPLMHESEGRESTYRDNQHAQNSSSAKFGILDLSAQAKPVGELVSISPPFQPKKRGRPVRNQSLAYKIHALGVDTENSDRAQQLASPKSPIPRGVLPGIAPLSGATQQSIGLSSRPFGKTSSAHSNVILPVAGQYSQSPKAPQITSTSSPGTRALAISDNQVQSQRANHTVKRNQSGQATFFTSAHNAEAPLASHESLQRKSAEKLAPKAHENVLPSPEHTNRISSTEGRMPAPETDINRRTLANEQLAVLRPSNYNQVTDKSSLASGQGLEKLRAFRARSYVMSSLIDSASAVFKDIERDYIEMVADEIGLKESINELIVRCREAAVFKRGN